MAEPVPILVPQEVVNDTAVRVVSLAFATGQQVQTGQAVAELETSKSNIQVEAPSTGWLRLLCKAGDDVPVGGQLGLLFSSQAELNAALLPPPAALQVAGMEPETITATPGITVFSDDARALLHASGLDEAAFSNMSFVRAADVRARLQPAAVQVETPPPAPITPEDTPFQQTSSDGWPLGMLIRSDLHRIHGRRDNVELLRHWWRSPGFRYVLWFRIAQWARKQKWSKILVYPFAVFFLDRTHFRTGIRIPLGVKAGPGLFLGHWGSMLLSPDCTIGANCTLGNDINIGSAGGSGKKGVPHLGDNVFIGPGVRIAGPVTIGQNAAIMANTLVTGNVPPNAIAIGVPHRISGRQESNPYISQTDYPRP